MVANEYSVGRVYMGRFEYGADLAKTLEAFIQENNIQMGSVKLIGAVQQANLGYYNPQTAQYEEIFIEEQLEVASGVGNISLKEGSPMAHVHLTVADSAGKCFAGHLLAGTIVFVSEFIIMEFNGPIMERKDDEATGVTIWS